MRPPLTLKRTGSSSSGGGGGSASTTSKPKLPLTDWSNQFIEEGGSGASLMIPPFASDVAADIVTIVKTLMGYKVGLKRKLKPQSRCNAQPHAALNSFAEHSH